MADTVKANLFDTIVEIVFKKLQFQAQISKSGLVSSFSVRRAARHVSRTTTAKKRVDRRVRIFFFLSSGRIKEMY